MEDRLSHLPEGVLHNILPFLSPKDATKTGILSKHWNSVWNSSPTLVIDEYEFKSWKMLYISKNHKNVKANFCGSVDRTMRRRYENSIFTERLDIRIYHERSRVSKVLKHLDSWIESAVTLKLKQLILSITDNQIRIRRGKDYALPQCVWNSPWLRVLKLNGCEFSGSMNTIGIGSSLRKLMLLKVRIDERTFHHVISSCFHLEDLRISRCVGFKVLYVVGLKGIHTVHLHLSGDDDQSVSVEAPSLQFLGFDGDSSSLGRIIQACSLKKLQEICLFNMDIFEMEYELEKLIPEFPWLEKLSLDKCKLKESFIVSSVRLMSFSLIECDNMTHIVLDACCLNQFRYRGKHPLDITWIQPSDDVEINLDLSFDKHDRLYNEISFDKIAMYLVDLPFCKVLTIIFNGKSKWIASQALDDLSCDIERLRIMIMKGRGQIGRHSCLLILEEFLRISRRPSSVLIESWEEESLASFVKLDFLYQHEEIDGGQLINRNCACCGSSCWRCCLGELEISQSLLAMRGVDGTELVGFFKANALCLKKISFV